MANTTKNLEDRLFGTLDKVKDRVSKVHENLLMVSNETVEDTLKAGAEWQKVLVASIKKGEKLLEAQQDLAFEALEGIKNIHLENVKRFRHLVKDEQPIEAKKVSAKVKETKKVVIETVKAAEETAQKVQKKITDLKTINGIGPKLEEILNEAGIQSLGDLVTTPLEKLNDVLEAAGPRYKAFSPEDWKKQATDLLKA